MSMRKAAPGAQGKDRQTMSSIQNIIAEADRGQLRTDTDFAIEEILTALNDDYERTGEVTIKVKFATKNGVVQILPELSHKLSKPARVVTFMFLTDDGELSRRDPRQPVMPSVVEADFANGARRPQTQEED